MVNREWISCKYKSNVPVLIENKIHIISLFTEFNKQTIKPSTLNLQS
jgi:hypothetical protein